MDKLSAGSVSTSAAVNSRPARSPVVISSGVLCYRNLNGAQNIAVVEGFATGASVWLATRKDPKKSFDAVVVAVAANNMIHVVEQLVNMYPQQKLPAPWITTASHRLKVKATPAYVPASTFSQNLAASNAFIPPLKTIPSWSAATSTTCTDYVDSARPVASYSPKGTA